MNILTNPDILLQLLLHEIDNGTRAQGALPWQVSVLKEKKCKIEKEYFFGRQIK